MEKGLVMNINYLVICMRSHLITLKWISVLAIILVLAVVLNQSLSLCNCQHFKLLCYTAKAEKTQIIFVSED